MSAIKLTDIAFLFSSVDFPLLQLMVTSTATTPVLLRDHRSPSIVVVTPVMTSTCSNESWISNPADLICGALPKGVIDKWCSYYMHASWSRLWWVYIKSRIVQIMLEILSIITVVAHYSHDIGLLFLVSIAYYSSSYLPNVPTQYLWKHYCNWSFHISEMFLKFSKKTLPQQPLKMCCGKSTSLHAWVPS